MSDADLMKLQTSNNLKSPEILELFDIAKSSKFSLVQPDELLLMDNFCETGDDILVSGKGNVQSQLVDASGIDKLGLQYVSSFLQSI